MRQVDQRVCGYHRLAPMSRDAVGGYIQHRLRIAGGGPERVLFPPEIVDALHSRSGGVPRLINRVCDHALQLAYERCAEVVSREILDAALLEIGAATLSPTWDSIVHAQPASEARPAAPEARPAAPETGPVVNAVDLTPTIDDREDFHRQVDQWVAQDLASPAPAAPPPSTPVQRPPSATRAYRNEWPSDVRSETYMQRFWRMWLRRVAIAGALYLAAHVAIAGLSFTADIFSRPAPEAAPLPPPVQPAPVPVQPAPVAPGRSPADAPNPDPVVASTAAPPAVAVTSGDYFVAVGLFADGARADRLVDTLIKAGLPAMQRPSELRGQPVQRVVLGPFVSRTDAIAGLRRLQALGGHDDARVIGQ
jgi:cell division septation protein DedD